MQFSKKNFMLKIKPVTQSVPWSPPVTSRCAAVKVARFGRQGAGWCQRWQDGVHIIISRRFTRKASYR